MKIMKVKELIEVLQTHNPEAAVFVTWEGMFRTLEPSHVYSGPKDTVFIDGDESHYKEDIINGHMGPYHPTKYG